MSEDTLILFKAHDEKLQLMLINVQIRSIFEH